MNPIKFTEEEITEINNLKKDYENVLLQLGQLEVEKKKMTSIESQLWNIYNELTEKERVQAKKLSDKYGEGQLDPSTGIFTPSSK
jgi:hypothetical protein